MDPGRSRPPAWQPVVDEFRESTVVLTGVGKPGQVGEVVAATFASRGARVIVVDREAADAQARASDLAFYSAQAHGLGCDLTDPVQVRDMATTIDALAPAGVHAVVHMAGGYVDGTAIADLDPAALHKLIAINLTTAFLATKALIPLARKARGSMVYFASAAALPGASVARSAAYAASKGGVITLMRAVAAEERSNGVRANALAPQAIRTESNLATMGPAQQYVEREQVAASVLWLCSQAAAAVTGQVIRLA